MGQPEHTWKVVVAPGAAKYIERLPADDRRRVVAELERLRRGLWQRGLDVVRLRGEEGAWRVRIGAWRAVVRVDPPSRTILVVLVRPRGDVYKH